jgi:RNA polymerase sigma factor (sigma-70 family)
VAESQMSQFIEQIRRAVLLREGACLTDRQLLEDYLGRRDGSALEALVRRHAPMVWGICCRVLRERHDAEDAFQATFLVLVRRASAITAPELLANWLYGVAQQTARKARATAAKRRARESQVTQMPEPAVTEPDRCFDLRPLLDEELSRLPDKYRVAIVLCELEGKTRKEAAGQLGVPEGTLAARLARGRVMLAKRLARHGLVPSGGTLAALLSQGTASACVPDSVLSSTIEAASLVAAGHAASAGVISANVAALTEGVLKSMLVSKLKVATVVALCLLVGLGGGTLALLPRAAGQQKVEASDSKEEKQAKDKKDDKKKETDKDKLQGKWAPVSIEKSGKTLDVEDAQVQQKIPIVVGFWALKFDGDKVTPDEGEKVAYTLDESKKPREMDVELGGNFGTMKAIYEFDGAKLKLCVIPKGDRPSDFDTSSNTGFLFVFEKKKE